MSLRTKAVERAVRAGSREPKAEEDEPLQPELTVALQRSMARLCCHDGPTSRERLIQLVGAAGFEAALARRRSLHQTRCVELVGSLRSVAPRRQERLASEGLFPNARRHFIVSDMYRRQRCLSLAIGGTFSLQEPAGGSRSEPAGASLDLCT